MEGELVEVFITHVEDDGPLLKLWAQIDRKTPSLIERTIDQLTPQFEQGVGIPEPHNLTVGQLCCAKYSDGIYYRARITSLANLSNGEVAVQFADYGNLETIALHNMRSFEGLLTVLSTIADQAMDFYLAGVVPTTGEWTPRSLKFVKDIICYVDLKCMYVGHTEGVTKQLIKLFYQNMDFAIYLIERGVCVTILLATQISLLQSIVNHKALPPLQLWPRYNPDVPPPLPMSSLMVTAAMAKACEKNLVESVAMNRTVYAPPGLASQPPPGMHPSMNYPVHPPPGMAQHEYPTYSDAYRSNHNMQQRQTPPMQMMQRPPPVPQVEVAASFETPHLEVNSRHEVRIAFVEDGPNSFVVFLKNMEKVLGDMLSDINSKPATPLKKLPMIGSICLGKYSRDQSLCRAVVTNVLADSCVVAYVDFGHSETLPYSEIFELPQKYIKNPCVMAVRFSHARLPGFEITPEVKRLFKECVVNKYFTLCVVPSEGHRLQQYGVLIDGGGRLVIEVVREITEARKISDYARITSLHKGSTKPILVSFVENVNSFYVQIEDSAEALTALMSDVLAHCEGDARKLEAADVQNGLLCCARFAEDGQWYRAQVTKMTKEGIFVNYVDYGNTEAVQLDALREIKPELVTCLKAQAVRCCLKNFKDAPASDELIDIFSELTADKNLIMMVGEVDQSGCLVVELHDLTSSPPVILSVELQKSVKRGVHEKTNQQPDQSYRAPTGFSNAISEPKPVAETRQTERGSGDYKNQQQGQRTEAPSDWRAKGDDRSGGPRQAADWPRADKIDTWEGSSENRAGAAKIAPPQMPLGTVRSAQLIYAENPEDFYVQLTPDLALTELMAKIAGAHEGGAGRPVRQATRGAACVAQFSEDDTWYRANVLSVDDDRAKVQFVDYGNSDFVALQNLREISPDFVKFPAQAIKCSLKDALPKGSNWSDDEINGFVLAIDGKPLEVKFVAEKNGLYAVVVKDNQTQKVVNEDFGAPVEAPAHRAPVEAPVQRAPVERPPYRAAQPEPAPKPKPAPPQVQKPVQHFVGPDERFLYQEFQPGAVEKVNVCWLTSPDNFYVQCTSQAGRLDTTMREIQTAYAGTASNTDTLVEGSPIVAKYRGDNSLCRAEVTATRSPTTYAVHFVDYGNSDLVPKRSTWRVDRRFVDLPKQAVLCALPELLPADAEWPKSNADLDALFQDEEYECTFIGWLDGKYHVSLVHKGASVADELVAKGLARLPVYETEVVAAEVASIEEPVEAELFLGQTLKVVIPYVEGIAKFYVHLEGNLSEAVQALVDGYVLTPENLVALPTDRVKVGQMCLATSDGAQWYRARIVDPAGTAGIYVVFVDYGDGDELTADKLMTIPEHLSAYPAQAIECSLSGWETTVVEAEVEDLFKANNEGETAIIHVDSVDQDRLSVTVFTLACKKQPLLEHIGDGLKEVGLIRPLPILAQKATVCVSHAASPWSVWLQKLSDLDPLTEQLGQMFTFYEEGRGADVALAQDAFCAAKSPTDEQWYRARVEETKPGAVVRVRFVDYGNCEDVKEADVKALDPAFFGPHAFAVEATLPLRRDNVADIDLIDVAAMTADVEYVAVFAREGADKWCAELFNNKETLSGKLVEMGLEFVVDYPFEKYVEELTKSPKLVPGMTLQAFVSHPGDPTEFWIQHADNSEVIDLFQASLQEAADTLEDLLEPAVDGLCLAQFSEDGSWYRATILETTDSEATVRFVDYGNTDVVDTTANPLKALTYALAKVERYAVKCSLNVAPIDAQFTEEAIERFSALVASTEDSLLVEVIAEGNVVDLWLGDVSFVAALLAEGHAGERCDENSVFVSHVNSPSEFWIQYQSATRRLDAMAERLLEAAAFEALASCEEGALCAARFAEDELWYRARVIGRVDEATAVLFVDYGNASVSNEVRALPADLLEEPPLAKRCSLATEHETLWTDEATVDFNERVAEGATPFIVKIDAEGDPMLVTLTDESNVIVNKVLAELAVVITEGSATVPELETGDSDVVTISADETVDESKPVAEGVEDTLPVDVALDDTLPVDVALDDTLPVVGAVETEPADSVTDLLDKLNKEEVEEDVYEGKLNIVFEPNLTTKEMMEEMLEKKKIKDELTDDLVESVSVLSVETESDPKCSEDGATLELVKSVAELSVGKEVGDISVESPLEDETVTAKEGGDVAGLDMGVEESAGIEDSSLADETTGLDGLGDTEVDKKWKAVVEKSFTEQALEDETFLSAEESDTSTLEDYKSPDKLPSPEQPLGGRCGETIPALESINDVEEDLKSTNVVAACPSTPAHVSAPVSRPMTPYSDRIVPGSVCRGVSQEELDKYKFDPEVDGKDLARSSDEEEEEVQAKSCPSTPVPREMLRAASSCEDFVASPVRLKHSERIVPGSISGGSSLEEIAEVAAVANGNGGLSGAEVENIEIAKGIVQLVIEQSEASVMSQVKDCGVKGVVMENGSTGKPAEKEMSNGDGLVGNDSEIHEAD